MYTLSARQLALIAVSIVELQNRGNEEQNEFDTMPHCGFIACLFKGRFVLLSLCCVWLVLGHADDGTAVTETLHCTA